MLTTNPAISAAPRRRVGVKAIVATSLGNALEVFDFSVYALFAVLIGKAFFPDYSSFGQLMLSVSVFAVGFVARPLGAVVLGAYADRAGRKAALTLTILMMAFGTGLLGLTPGYDQIGVAAPLLVLFARLLQGFSAGGELGAATTYLLEMAPPEKRGLYASWQSASQGIAIALGGLVGFLSSVLLTPEQLQSWGWRIPFLIGILIAPIGFYIRSQLDDTVEGETLHGSSGTILRELFRYNTREVLLSTACIIGPTISVYIVSNYMTTYGLTVLKLPTSTSMLSALVAGLTALVAAVIGGRLSDRFGRRLLTVTPQVLVTLLIYPAFLFINQQGTGFALLSMVCVLTFVRAMSSAVVIVQIPECFPAAVRTTGLSISYAAAVSIFGGTAQPIVTWLLKATGDPMSPAWYLIGANVVSVIAMALLKARPAPAPAQALVH